MPEPSLPAPRFLCAGAAHWDIIARTDAALPPGADVPGRIARQPGGVALNIALALAGLGHSVTLLGALGTDPEGDALAARIAGAGIATSALTRYRGATDCYVAIEGADGSLLAGIADCTGLGRAGATLLEPLRAAWPGPMLLDGNLAPSVLSTLADAATGRLALVPASPQKAAPFRTLLSRPATLYLNLAEAQALAGRSFADTTSAARALVALGAAEAVVTDGANPASAASGDGTTSLRPPPVAARSVTGAGDAFVAAHFAAREAGLPPEPALAAALVAAARHLSRQVA